MDEYGKNNASMCTDVIHCKYKIGCRQDNSQLRVSQKLKKKDRLLAHGILITLLITGVKGKSTSNRDWHCNHWL